MNALKIGIAVGVCLVIAAAGADTAAKRSAQTIADNNAQATGYEVIYADGAVYPLDEDEYELVCRVVMGEAGGEPYKGQVAVAQCILNACRIEDKRPGEIIEEYQYTTWQPEPSESVRTAVCAVFDDGVTVFGDDVLYFYAPAQITSDWHETKELVTEIGGHRFFKEK